MYALYGVVVHTGSLKGGHYIAYVRVRKDVTEESATDITGVNKLKSIANISIEISDIGNLEITDEKCEGADNISSSLCSVSASDKDFDYSSLYNSEWYCISDVHVKKVSDEEVYQSQAYLLFYEKLRMF